MVTSQLHFHNIKHSKTADDMGNHGEKALKLILSHSIRKRTTKLTTLKHPSAPIIRLSLVCCIGLNPLFEFQSCIVSWFNLSTIASSGWKLFHMWKWQLKTFSHEGVKIELYWMRILSVIKWFCHLRFCNLCWGNYLGFGRWWKPLDDSMKFWGVRGGLSASFLNEIERFLMK